MITIKTHSTTCLAQAIIRAVENLRDASDDYIDFRLAMQENRALVEADNRLSDGTFKCQCERPGVDITITNRNDGSVVAHRTGCRDIKHDWQNESFALGTFSTEREVTECYNGDFDEEVDGWYVIDFKPCCGLER